MTAMDQTHEYFNTTKDLPQHIRCHKTNCCLNTVSSKIPWLKAILTVAFGKVPKMDEVAVLKYWYRGTVIKEDGKQNCMLLV